MKRTTLSTIFEFSRLVALSLALAVNTSAFAQKQAAKAAGPQQARLVLGVNEGGSGSASATDIVFRYEEFRQIVEKALGTLVILAPVRELKALRNSLETGAYSLVLLRPADIAAEAVRDYGYQAIVVSKEPAYTLFIVNKDSPLKTIADVKGKSIVTPERYGYQWRVASAMMRDSNISIVKEQVRIMLDQAAIGWSMESGFYDVGVVSTFSAVGRTWEKNGGRVIARTPELPNTPLIASPKISAAQIRKLRAALVPIESTESGVAILKKMGVAGGFKEASSQTFIDLIKWLGDMETPKN